MLSVNALCQEAAELCSMVGDQEAMDGSLAASFLNLLNRTIAKLNNDSYFSSCMDTVDATCAGELYFKQLEENEALPDDITVVNMDPPECVVGTSRQLGIRWIELLPSNPQDMAAAKSMTLPSHYCYETSSEVAPSGKVRLVGRLSLNGHGRATIKVFLNRRFPEYKLTDSIPVSPIYHDAILYSLAYAACVKYKLDDYKQEIRDEKNSALAVIDRNTLNNRAMENSTRMYNSYDQAYNDGLAGNNLQL